MHFIGTHMIIPVFITVTCIWGYMGCAKQDKKPDRECKEDFNGCSMIAMGMAPPSTTARYKDTFATAMPLPIFKL